MKDLIERLEKATGPDRSLDGEIARILGWSQERVEWAGHNDIHWKSPNGNLSGEPPYYTRDLDAAQSVVPRDMLWSVGTWSDNFATVGPEINVDTAPSPAIALCIAALKARES